MLTVFFCAQRANADGDAYTLGDFAGLRRLDPNVLASPHAQALERLKFIGNTEEQPPATDVVDEALELEAALVST